MARVNTTFPRLLMENAQKYGQRVAMREKRKGIWHEISWQAYVERVMFLAMGLRQLGLTQGSHAAILGENSPEWLFSDLAIQSLRAVSIGIYPTNPPDQVRYILDHSRSKMVVVKDQEQLDKVLTVRGHLPLLEKTVVIDMKGLRRYRDPMIISFREVEGMGKEAVLKEPGLFETLVGQVQPDDIAFIVYTSGTTGPPKGAMISHRNNIHMIVQGLQPILHFTEQDSLVSYLPLCHILERNLSMGMALVFGYTINFAESIETVQKNIQEISPTFFAAVPRILEKLHSAVVIRMEDSTRFKKAVTRFWEPVGGKAAQYRMQGERPPFTWWFLYLLGYLSSFRAIRDKMGLLHCRCLMSGGAPIAPEVLDFFRGLGIHTVELYGLTEVCGTVSGPHRFIKPGSVGEPCGALEFRLAEDGEIFLKGDSVFAGYYRDPEATREIIQDGWLHTGDVGQLDEDGHLFIIDRKKDIIITSGGKNISPSEIENRMKCSPFIKEAVVLGDRRKYLSALIQLDFENVGNWAQTHRIAYTNYRSLAQNPQVHGLIKEEVEKVNEDLAQVEAIKRFHILEKELDQDDEELTATQKVKRKVIAERFKEEIAGMYR